MHKGHSKKHDGKDVKSNLEIAMEKVEKMTTGAKAHEKGARKEAHLPEEELSELREQAAKAGEYHDRWLRAAADLENYKKRAERERSDIQKYAHEEIMSDLLVVLDNFERALKAAETGAGSEQLTEGVKLIQKQLLTVLQKYGLRPIEAIGKPFNPEYHEAVAQAETDEHPEGTVLTEQLKGYTLNGRLLRPAVVVTSKSSTAGEGATSEEEPSE
ncbi:MAG: nucleotide exchange factor GrpE [bacterium]